MTDIKDVFWYEAGGLNMFKIDCELVGMSDRTAIYKLYIVRELVDDALSDMDGEQ